MMLDVRRGLPPTSISLGSLHTPHLPSHNPHSSSIPPTSTSAAHDDHQPPTSPILNLSKSVSSEAAAEERDEDDEREAELRSQGSFRTEDDHLPSARRLNSKSTNNGPSVPSSAAVSSAGGVGVGIGGSGGVGGGVSRGDEDRLSDMDDEEADKDECKFIIIDSFRTIPSSLLY